ncbi:MAG: RNA-binding transcriptional accessory protein [Lactobacillales bacterium]|jgi:uncharacterized protein|nr:RNA-binding transcriptional accessory protein [Lactobacillales bacterium]
MTVTKDDFEYLAKLLKIFPQYKKFQVESTLRMLSEGDTIPFIARYRKEKTGNLDEVAILEISQGYERIETLEKRKLSVLSSIEEQDKLTEELQKNILSADKLQIVEDLYRPYKQKRRTKATIAKEKGLQPLADLLLNSPEGKYLEEEAQKFLNEEQEIYTISDVYNGVHEILAEFYGEDVKLRAWTRNFFERTGILTSSEKDSSLDEKGIFDMYHDFSERLLKMQNHRVLAMNRGEKLGILAVNLDFEEEFLNVYFEKTLIPSNVNEEVRNLLRKAYLDAFKRFIRPQIEREIRAELTDKAQEEAILLFGENLKNLLLQSPLKGQTILGFDPAYRTGAKLAVVDHTGKMLTTQVIYPVKPASVSEVNKAKKDLKELIEKYEVDTIAIGNGTASRESEQFVVEVLKDISRKVFYTIVSEAGASVYSASEIARNEFADLPVERRSAISIARRLLDPLAELVKVEPKAIGVGQYQHDVSQSGLEKQLNFVVETTVNQVGVNVNTASPQLLEHVSGFNSIIAKNLVKYREEGIFLSRVQVKKVPRLGPKAYEQAAGFLRIVDGKNPLDNTGIHPESYDVAERLLASLGFTVRDLGSEKLNTSLRGINVKDKAESLEIGELTLQDILDALARPGRDLREDAPKPLLRSDVLSIKDLTEGMELTGTVRNVVDFGVFVDIGVKNDGLVHISRMSSKFVKHPTELVSVGDIVQVWVIGVSQEKMRVSLSMLDPKK